MLSIFRKLSTGYPQAVLFVPSFDNSRHSVSYRALLGIELPLIEELVILYFSEMELLAHKEISPLIEYEGQRDFEGERVLVFTKLIISEKSS